MTETSSPDEAGRSGDDLQLTGKHWTFIIKLYGDVGVQRACLYLQDSFGVDVSLLLTLVWSAAQGAVFADDDVAALDAMIAPWRSDAVTPLRTMRRTIKQVAERDDAVAGFRNRIKSLEIEAEQIEIALLVQALVRRAGRGAGGAPALPESIRRTVETVVGFFATKVATPWRTPAVDAAMNALADHAARVAAAGGGPA